MLQLTTVFFLIAFAVLAVIHKLAIELFLYWHIRWLDIPIHALGGAVVALGFFTLRDLGLFPNKFLKPVSILLLVLGVALIWEVFERVVGIPSIGDYVIDTSIDVAMGLLGAYVGYIIGNNLRNLR